MVLRSEWACRWRKQGEGVFYVYILQLADGGYYVGHTDNLRASMLEHRNGTSKTTNGHRPVLRYFEVTNSRLEARGREVELKELAGRDMREIRRMVIEFGDLVGEVGKD